MVAPLNEVIGMSEESVRNLFKGDKTVEIDIEQLVSEIKKYVNTKPKDFRLLFMADEVGQYIGDDRDLLLNLQSLIEKIGSECGGKVWVVCTGQEAIDEIIKARENEFSRIQARFNTRLSLTSSSVDEVIQKRILQKKQSVEPVLEDKYNGSESILRNLFTFTNAVKDIKGYTESSDFVKNYPFVPYQFIILPKVFAEIRKHGNTGKHLSGGERSMLSGFQEAAQKIMNKNVDALAPFYLFYDTVHSFLDSSIREVIERCLRAAENRDGIEPQDVDLLKLLYLLRYIDDVPANIDNIVILMADNINVDKVVMRNQVRGSLDRLQSQNYIGLTADIYNFLTDEEQEIQREIFRNTLVDNSAIVADIGTKIFTDIYTTRKYRYKNNDFFFDQRVDTTNVGNVTGGMILQILTEVTDSTEKSKLHLMTDSKGKAIVVLADTPYFKPIENALKIDKYAKQKNFGQLSEVKQAIISNYRNEAENYKKTARQELENAIVNAELYVDGEEIQIKTGSAKEKLDKALEYLVSHVYSELDLINKNADTDADILSALKGGYKNHMMPGMPNAYYNYDAAVKVEEFLEIQKNKNLTTSMGDIQRRYRGIPYGWREIDIAVVVAMLIHEQKVTVKYGAVTIQPNDPKLPDMLRKKSEVDKTEISKRQSIAANKMRDAKVMLGDYFYEMNIPPDEDGLVDYIVKKFEEQKKHYEELLNRYNGHRYPGHELVKEGIALIENVLSQRQENTALINRLLNEEDNLIDNQEDMEHVEEFFKNQVQIFDEAVQMEKALHNEHIYLQNEVEADSALNQIRKIVVIDGEESTVYNNVPLLNELMAKVQTGYNKVLEAKRTELHEIIRQCLADIHSLAGNNAETQKISNQAEIAFDNFKIEISQRNTITQLIELESRLWLAKDRVVQHMEAVTKPSDSVNQSAPVNQPASANIQSGTGTPAQVEYSQQSKKIRTIYRQGVLSPQTLESEEDIDAYVEAIRKKLTEMMKDNDGIKIV